MCGAESTSIWRIQPENCFCRALNVRVSGSVSGLRSLSVTAQSEQTRTTGGVTRLIHQGNRPQTVWQPYFRLAVHMVKWVCHKGCFLQTDLNFQCRCYLQCVLIPAPFRFYRACLQRTSLCSLLTGALLEATTALGARSTIPYPFPQGLNSHAVLKGGCFIPAWMHREEVSRI